MSVNMVKFKSILSILKHIIKYLLLLLIILSLWFLVDTPIGRFISIFVLAVYLINKLILFVHYKKIFEIIEIIFDAIFFILGLISFIYVLQLPEVGHAFPFVLISLSMMIYALLDW